MISQEIKNTLNSIDEGFCVLDERGQVVFINSTIEKWFGKKCEEVIGKSFEPEWYSDEKEREKAIKSFQKLLKEGGSYTNTYNVNSPEGHTKSISCSGSLFLTDDNKQMVICHIKDISDYKEKEVESKQNKTFLDSIIENIPHMIFVKHAKDLSFAAFNKAGEDLIGLPREELLGKTDYDFFPKEEADFFTKKDREVLNERKLVDIPEETLETKHGRRLLHTKKIPLYDAEGNPEFLLGISEDITHKKDIQKQVEESELKFRTLYDLAADAIFTVTPKGKVINANTATRKLLGYTKEEVEQLTGIDIVAPEVISNKEHEHHTWAKQVQEGGNFTVETVWLTKKGKRVPVSVTGKPLELQGETVYQLIGRDITQQQINHKKIKDSETKLRLITDHATDIISRHDAEGKYVFISPSCESILGYTPEELIGRSALNFVHPEDLQWLKKEIDNIGNMPIENTTRFRFQKKDGSYCWMESKSKNIKNPYTGEIDQIIAVSRDITEQRKYLQQLKDNAQELDNKKRLQESILDNLGEGVVVCDEKGNFLSFNQMAKEILGIGPNGSSAGNWSKDYGLFHMDKVTLFKEEELPLVKATMGIISKDVDMYVKNPTLKEDTYVRVNAQPFLDNDGNIKGGIAIFHDITNRIKAKEEKEKLENKLRDYTQQLPKDPVVLTNDASLTIISLDNLQREIDSVIIALHNMPGLYLSLNKSHSSIEDGLKRRGVNIDQLFFIDCVADQNSSEDVLNIPPDQLYRVSEVIKQFNDDIKQEKFIIIDSMSLLLIHNSEEKVITFIEHVIEDAAKHNTKVFCFCSEQNDFLDKIKGFFKHVKKEIPTTPLSE